MATKRQPWDKRDDETDDSFQSFTVYRDMGADRTLEGTLKVNKKSSKSLDVIKRWSAQHDWVKRSAAYDAHLDRVELEAIEKEVRKKAVQRYRKLATVNDLAIGVIEKQLQEGILDPRQVAPLMKIVTDQTRLALGLSTDKIDHNHAVDAETSEGLTDLVAGLRSRTRQ